MNIIMWQYFETIYIKLKDFFEVYFKCKVLYPAYNLSLPGFHIFEIGKKIVIVAAPLILIYHINI